MADLPPLPAGFTLDAPSGGIPPLPPGFKLDAAPNATPAPQERRLLPAPVEQSITDRVLRQIALTGRSAAEGVMGTLYSPLDLAVEGGNALQHLSNRVLGTKLYDYPTFASRFSQGLTAAGAPVPETPSEQMTSAVTRGATGALAGGGALGMTGTGNALRAGLSGATGAGASEGVRQAGGGPGLQAVAGMVGSAAPTAVEGVARGVGAMVSPFFKAGQRNIAGRTLAAAATDAPTATAMASQPQELVPGSTPTLGEATRDPGLAALQNRLRNLSPQDFSAAETAQNTARQTLLDGISKTSPEIEAMAERRDALTGAMRDRAFQQAAGKQAPVTQITDAIDGLLADPENAGKSVQAALTDVRSQVAGKTDVRALYAVRKEIDRVLEGRYVGADESVLRYAGSQLGEVKDAIDGAISTVAPGWKGYLNKYAQLSRPIDRAQTLADIRSRTSVAVPDLATGQDVLSQAKWRAVVGQNRDALAETLTKGQMTKLDMISADLDRGAAAAAAGRARGSDTAANLMANDQMSIANLIGQATGGKIKDPSVITGSIARPLTWLFKLPESRIHQLIVEAMTDPALGAKLLQRATAQNISDFSSRLSGLASGIAGTAIATPPTTDTATSVADPTLLSAATRPSPQPRQ